MRSIASCGTPCSAIPEENASTGISSNTISRPVACEISLTASVKEINRGPVSSYSCPAYASSVRGYQQGMTRCVHYSPEAGCLVEQVQSVTVELRIRLASFEETLLAAEGNAANRAEVFDRIPGGAEKA